MRLKRLKANWHIRYFVDSTRNNELVEYVENKYKKIPTTSVMPTMPPQTTTSPTAPRSSHFSTPITNRGIIA
jgi:hypothetical protein